MLWGSPPDEPLKLTIEDENAVEAGVFLIQPQAAGEVAEATEAPSPWGSLTDACARWIEVPGDGKLVEETVCFPASLPCGTQGATDERRTSKAGKACDPGNEEIEESAPERSGRRARALRRHRCAQGECDGVRQHRRRRGRTAGVSEAGMAKASCRAERGPRLPRVCLCRVAGALRQRFEAGRPTATASRRWLARGARERRRFRRRWSRRMFRPQSQRSRRKTKCASLRRSSARSNGYRAAIGLEADEMALTVLQLQANLDAINQALGKAPRARARKRPPICLRSDFMPWCSPPLPGGRPGAC